METSSDNAGSGRGHRARIAWGAIVRQRWASVLPELLLATLILVGTTACSSTVPATATPTVAPPTATTAPSLSHTATPQPSGTREVIPEPPTPTLTPSASPTATAAPPTVTPTARAVTESTDLIAEFSADRAFSHVIKLAEEIGPRPAGSQSEARAREYVAETLRGYGYDIQQFPFASGSFKDAGSTVSVTAPLQQTFKGQAMSGVAVTDVTAELVPVGLGYPSDYADKSLKGKIALVKRGQITFREKVLSAREAGARAVVIYNNAAGPINGAVVENSGIPALTITGEDGETLHDLCLAGKVQVSLTINVVTEQNQSCNVIGEKGEDKPKVIVGAHIDSVSVAPGANDNASGVAVMLEVARLAANTDIADDLMFMAFGSEELGMVGSRSYVASLTEEQIKRIAAMINLDMVGEGSHLTLLYGAEDPLTTRLAREAREAGVVTALDRTREDSDHAPFARAGVPVVHLFTGIDAYYHSAGDTADKVQPDALVRAGKATLFLIQTITLNLN